MVALIKLIEEYGKLENLVGFTTGMNKGNTTTEEIELRNRRNKKYTELQEEILRLSREKLELEEIAKYYSKLI